MFTVVIPFLYQLQANLRNPVPSEGEPQLASAGRFSLPELVKRSGLLKGDYLGYCCVWHFWLTAPATTLL
jgi:hypothetical protein